MDYGARIHPLIYIYMLTFDLSSPNQRSMVEPQLSGPSLICCEVGVWTRLTFNLTILQHCTTQAIPKGSSVGNLLADWLNLE